MKPRLAILIASAISALTFSTVSAGDQTPHSGYQGWLDADYMTGDWGGLRARLADHGIELGLSYSAEVWGNTTGGIQSGAVYTGLAQFTTALDLSKLAGWKGASFYTRWLWLSGENASTDLVGNFFTVSNIAGFDTFRNIELWFQQKFWRDKVSLRIGQLAADQEFIISTYGALFINGTFGWPAFAYMNIPNGGPGYPMGTPGIRLSVTPTESLTLMAAVFQGNVFAESTNRYGFRWDLNADQGYLWLAEAQYAHDFWLPGTIKAGVWFDSAEFAVAADPDESVWGNYGIYFIVDQMLYREPIASAGQSKDANQPTTSSQGLGAFARIAFDPADRNFLGFYIESGLSYQGLIPSRDNDIAGIAFAYGQLTNGTKDLLSEIGLSGASYEIVVEATYLAQITPWLAIQPDAQVIIHPGGTTDLETALVVGGRATITF